MGKLWKLEVGLSFVSWMHAMRTELEWRKLSISWWEFWMPLQLNWRIALGGVEVELGSV